MARRRGRRSGTTSGRASSPRAKEWIDQHIDFNIVDGAEGLRSITTNLLDDEKKGATIIRCLVDMHVSSKTLNAKVLTAIGLTMLNDDGFAAGAVPDPGDSSDQPGWYWRAQSVIRGNESNVLESQHIEKDLRAMRKFRGQEDQLVLIIEPVGAAVDIDALFRTLILKS